jgi:hypothetical protein
VREAAQFGAASVCVSELQAVMDAYGGMGCATMSSRARLTSSAGFADGV